MQIFVDGEVLPILRRMAGYADAHRRLLAWLCVGGWIAWLAIGFMLGPHYDYTPYMRQWTRILAGSDPWQGDPDNAYGPGHAVLALLFQLHPLAPKMLFLLCWIGVFLIVFEAGQRDAAIGLISFLVLFATPFCFILVCIYGVEDALVTVLTLLAVDLRTRKGQSVLPAVLLGAAVLTKLYPLVLLPFLATDRGKVDLRFFAAALLSVAAGLAMTVAVWGWSFLRIVEFAALRDGKMLSIFWFLAMSGLSPLVGTPLAQTLIAWNAAIVAAAMAVFYLAQFQAKMSALAGTTIAMIGLLAFYKVGNPQYFVCSAALLTYYFAAQAAQKSRLDAGLWAAAAGYLAVLNAFQAWFIFFKNYTSMSTFIGLPCFIASLALLWRLMLHARLKGRKAV